MSLKKGKFQHNQSISLWNYTLSPGWREEEVKILKSALQLFGVGKWRKILESGCLPGKSIGQIYMQTQRLLGQQSLGDFMGLQIDLQAVFNFNMKKTDVHRKNNCIINTGDNPTKEERKRRIEQNRKEYGLSQEAIREIRLPKVKKDAPEYMTLEDIENEKFTNLEILTHLYNLRAEIQLRLQQIGEAADGVTKTSSGDLSKDDQQKKIKFGGSERSSVIPVTSKTIVKKDPKTKQAKQTAKDASGQKKKGKKIDSDDEEDISLDDINSKSSLSGNEAELDVESDEEPFQSPVSDEEEEEEDPNVINEEEIFQDDDLSSDDD